MPRRSKKQDQLSSLVLLGMFVLAFTAIGGSSYGGIFCFLAVVVPAGYVALNIWRWWQRQQRLRALSIADVDSMTGQQFEHYVASLLRYQGYQATVTVGSGDLGVDIVARKDGISLAVQCKRSSSSIPRTAVSDAVGGMRKYSCSRSMVVTNSLFTSGAVELARVNSCQLVGRDTLSQWVLNFQRQDQSFSSALATYSPTVSKFIRWLGPAKK